MEVGLPPPKHVIEILIDTNKNSIATTKDVMAIYTLDQQQPKQPRIFTYSMNTIGHSHILLKQLKIPWTFTASTKQPKQPGTSFHKHSQHGLGHSHIP
jgi:hypothetical protein